MSIGEPVVANAIANALKASGVLVRVSPEHFQSIVSRVEHPLVVRAEGGLLSKYHQYMVSYKGFMFYTKSPTHVALPLEAEVIVAEKIWLPQ